MDKMVDELIENKTEETQIGRLRVVDMVCCETD